MTTPIYHFTHFSNLPSIINTGSLLCDRLVKKGRLEGRNIAYKNIKQTRLNTAVEVSPGGFVGDYVPFYFGPRSPMLLAYTDGYVTGKQEKQDEIIYLVSTAEIVAKHRLAFAFTDGHPVQEPRAFYNDLCNLNEVDLPLMKQKYWNDTDEYPDRKRRRQAEFLVYQKFPWELLLSLGCRTKQVHTRLEQAIANLSHKPSCLIRPQWYYEGRG